MNKTLVVQSQHEGMRLDIFLKEVLDYSRSKINKEIKNKSVLVNGVSVKSGYIIKKNDIITLEILEEQFNLEPQKIDFKILFEDEYIMVISKPENLVVHPGAGVFSETLVNGLLNYNINIKDVGEEDRPGIVHRLDKDTSGLMIIAKDTLAYKKLVNMFKYGEIHKEYLAILTGHLENEIRVDEPIGRNPKDRKSFTVIYSNSKNAISTFVPIKYMNGFTLCRVIIETGRTHQIRVHARYLNYPVLGDSIYGYKNSLGIKTQLLHAYKLTFNHPITGEELSFEDDFPDRFTKALEKIDRL